jgi:hypothetical protein
VDFHRRSFAADRLTLGICCFTPLGGREMAFRMTQRDGMLSLPLATFLALTIMLLTLPVLVARWRMARRGEGLGFRSRWWPGAITTSALVVFITGYLKIEDYRVLWALVIVGTLWPVIAAMRTLFSKSGHLLWRMTISRVLVPSWTLALACMVVAGFGFRASHRYWFGRDDFMKLRADQPGMMAYEYRVAEEFRNELLEYVGEIP